MASNYGDSLATEGCPHTTLLPLQKKQRGQREWPSRQVAIIGGASGVALVAAVVLLFGQGGSTETTPAPIRRLLRRTRQGQFHVQPQPTARRSPVRQQSHSRKRSTTLQFQRARQHTPAPVAKSNAARAPTPGKRAPRLWRRRSPPRRSRQPSRPCRGRAPRRQPRSRRGRGKNCPFLLLPCKTRSRSKWTICTRAPRHPPRR